MAKIPAKLSTRLAAGIKRFQPILASARARDVSEADTVTIVKDVLAEVLGYDKYSEVTSEHLIRSTYCDLAVKLDGKLSWLIEVKSAGADLKEQHIKQAVDYAANQGCEWVALTNGLRWCIYRVAFVKPITNTLVVDIDFAALNHRKDADLELLWLISKEGWLKSHLDDYAAQREALNPHTVGAVLLSEPILWAVRRELRRVSPEARIEAEDIARVLQVDVIKRDVLEGDRALVATKLVAKSSKRSLRTKGEEDESQTAAHTEAALAAPLN
jgi:hypothetical protein